MSTDPHSGAGGSIPGGNSNPESLKSSASSSGGKNAGPKQLRSKAGARVSWTNLPLVHNETIADLSFGQGEEQRVLAVSEAVCKGELILVRVKGYGFPCRKLLPVRLDPTEPLLLPGEKQILERFAALEDKERVLQADLEHDGYIPEEILVRPSSWGAMRREEEAEVYGKTILSARRQKTKRGARLMATIKLAGNFGSSRTYWPCRPQRS